MSENEMLNRRIFAELFANSKIFLYLCRTFKKNAKLDNRNHIYQRNISNITSK